jgi:predicted unusual protein kinase regulating ubiquinone biosynthesis (AarF/ABC1/UbiB family)
VGRAVGLAGIVDEFGRNVLTELDYYSEAYNGRRLAATVQDVSGVDIPGSTVDCHRPGC